MRDLTTSSICSDTSLNLDDFYFHIAYLMFYNPRKLGKGSGRLGIRGWRLQGNMHGASEARLRTAENCTGSELCSDGPGLGANGGRLLPQTPEAER